MRRHEGWLAQTPEQGEQRHRPILRMAILALCVEGGIAALDILRLRAVIVSCLSKSIPPTGNVLGGSLPIPETGMSAVHIMGITDYEIG